MFASPSVLIKEVDKSALVKVSGLGLSVIILDAEIGPVDTLVQIDSEKTLYDTFGKPNDHNYEAWFAISTVIKYGGIVGVIRPSVSSEDYRLTNANIQKPERIPGISYDQNLIIKNQDDFEKVLNKDFLFSARYAGEYYNDIVVSIVDHGADQIIDFSDSIEELAVGDIITTSTGKKAIIYITGQPLTISLFEPNRRFEIGEEVYDSNNNLIGTVNEILENRIYDTLECVPGLKWSSFIGQPNTSEYCKQRNSKFDEFHIAVIDKSGRITGRPNSILEVFPFLSKAVDCRSSDGSSLFWRNVINRKSQYIYVGDDKLLIYDDSNPSFFTVFTREGTTEMVSSTRVITRENGMIYFGNDVNNPFSELLYYQTGSDDIICGNIDQKANSNYFALFRNLEEDFFNTPVFNFTLLGGQSYNYDDPELVYADIVASYDIFSDRNQFGDIDFILPGRITSDILVKLVQIVEQRKDCLTVCSPKKDAVINNSFDTIKVENIISFFRTLPTSTYAILDSGWKKIYDKFNDVYRYVPCAADVAGLCIRASRTNESWISPAGYIRGILIDGTGLYFSPNRSEAHRLYKNGINPIMNFRGIGTVLFGDKTSRVSNSAFHYIGVRRLFLQIERDIERISKFFLFEFNDQTGRTAYTDAINSYLRGIQGKRGIYDFRVVCDESNNDFNVIDQNGLNVNIYINPSRSINCIEIKLIVTSTGLRVNEFEEASSVGSECDNPYSIEKEFNLTTINENGNNFNDGVFVNFRWMGSQSDYDFSYQNYNHLIGNTVFLKYMITSGDLSYYIKDQSIRYNERPVPPGKYGGTTEYEQLFPWDLEGLDEEWSSWQFKTSSQPWEWGYPNPSSVTGYWYRTKSFTRATFWYPEDRAKGLNGNSDFYSWTVLPINQNGCIQILRTLSVNSYHNGLYEIIPDQYTDGYMYLVQKVGGKITDNPDVLWVTPTGSRKRVYCLETKSRTINNIDRMDSTSILDEVKCWKINKTSIEEFIPPTVFENKIKDIFGRHNGYTSANIHPFRLNDGSRATKEIQTLDDTQSIFTLNCGLVMENIGEVTVYDIYCEISAPKLAEHILIGTVPAETYRVNSVGYELCTNTPAGSIGAIEVYRPDYAASWSFSINTVFDIASSISMYDILDNNFNYSLEDIRDENSYTGEYISMQQLHNTVGKPNNFYLYCYVYDDGLEEFTYLSSTDPYLKIKLFADTEQNYSPNSDWSNFGENGAPTIEYEYSEQIIELSDLEDRLIFQDPEYPGVLNSNISSSFGQIDYVISKLQSWGIDINLDFRNFFGIYQAE